MSTSLQIRPVGAGDHAAWLPLWEGYQRFYKTEIAAALPATPPGSASSTPTNR